MKEGIRTQVNKEEEATRNAFRIGKLDHYMANSSDNRASKR